MLDERMLGIPNKPNRPVVEYLLPWKWADFEELDLRIVDIELIVLTYGAILSEHECV